MNGRYVPATCILILLLLSRNMVYATQWNLIAAFLYWCLPAEVADYYGLTQFVFAISWTVAVTITIIIIQDAQVIKDACAQYSCPVSWLGHIIIHYCPPVGLTIYLYRHVPSLYLLQSYRRQLAAAMTVSVVSVYCVYMDPLKLYHVSGCLLNLAASVNVYALGALVFLKFLVASVAGSTLAKGQPTA